MPSEKILQQKKEAVQKLAEDIKRAAAGILVDYRGLTVEQDTKLRKQLREAGIDYRVVKNTLTRFAIQDTDYSAIDEHLHGPSSLALSYEDPVTPAKILNDFAKENDALEIKVGFVDGKVIDTNEIKALAELPPREVLIAKVLGGLNGPIAGFANVLNANLRGLVIALNAIAEQKQAEAQ